MTPSEEIRFRLVVLKAQRDYYQEKGYLASWFDNQIEEQERRLEARQRVLRGIARDTIRDAMVIALVYAAIMLLIWAVIGLSVQIVLFLSAPAIILFVGNLIAYSRARRELCVKT